MLRNIGSNILGAVLPALAALVAVPLLIEQLGIGVFGVFSLQVAALFFFGLSDLGISRAIVLLSFDEPFSGSEGWHRPYRIGLRYSLMLGASAALLALPVGLALFNWPIAELGRLDLALSTSLILVSAGITLVSLAPRAVLEAQQRFFVANAIRGPAAAAIFLAPLAALAVSETLTSAAVGILLTRLLALGCYFWSAGLAPTSGLAGDRTLRRAFLHKAGWLGLTNVLSMLTLYLDRFVLGFFGGAVMVGQFVIAQEVVTKLWIASGAVMSAAMPRLAAQRDEPGGAALRRTTHQLVAIMVVAGVLPAAVLIVAGAAILELWLGNSFDPTSVLPLMIMSVGLGINTLAQINFALLQVHGGERHTALLQIFNVVFASLALPVLIALHGIDGAALAFALRLFIDAVLVRALLSRVDERCRDIGIGYPGLLAAAALLLGLLIVCWGR